VTDSILVATSYGRLAPSARVRALHWIDRLALPHVESCYLGLAAAGAATVVRHPAESVRAERTVRTTLARTYDRVLIQRGATPFSRGRLEAGALRRAGWGVYDFDDALQWDQGSGSPIRRLRPNRSVVFEAVPAADRVIAGNHVLADWAAATARDVVVIPSCVEPDAYAAKTSFALHDPPLIGWIGSWSTEQNLGVCASALLEVHRRTGARLQLLSSGGAGTLPKRLLPMTDRISWSEALAGQLPSRWDVGVMPLFDRPLQRGKCGYKLLQYAAAGLPAIGSPVGVNLDILAKSAGVCAQPQDWADALLQVFALTEDRRAESGRQAREVITAEYSYDTWAPQWCKALELEV
jgi:glycosyltransferase involved in cell wall biosynthesis